MSGYKFGCTSLERLKGVHPDLVRVVNRVMDYQIMDFSVNEGVRTREKQEDLVKSGFSRTMYSKHLIQRDSYGHAVDLYPYPINMQKMNQGYWPEIIRFGVLAGLMKTAAKEEKVLINWGVDWDNDGETLDHSFFDAPHFELR